jgi:NADH:ubiquinone oxidoreductase subunit 4 (subunit M)
MELREFIVLIPPFILIFFMGIYPSYFTYYMHSMSNNLAFLVI